MDITTVFGTVIGGSNPSEGAKLAPVAQLVEQRTLNPLVVGSSPTGRTKIICRQGCLFCFFLIESK